MLNGFEDSAVRSSVGAMDCLTLNKYFIFPKMSNTLFFFFFVRVKQVASGVRRLGISLALS